MMYYLTQHGDIKDLVLRTVGHMKYEGARTSPEEKGTVTLETRDKVDIIVFDPAIYNQLLIQEPLTVKVLNLVANSNLTLVDNASDLIELLTRHLDLQTYAIAVYGLLDGVISTGQELNQICYLLRKLSDFGTIVNVSDPMGLDGDIVNISEPSELRIPVRTIISKWAKII